MTRINKDTRASMILQFMGVVENSPLSINPYFKENNTPFGQAQYYIYKKARRERGIEGVYDQRSKGNNLKFTKDMKNFMKRLLEYNRSMNPSEVQNAIKNSEGYIPTYAQGAGSLPNIITHFG